MELLDKVSSRASTSARVREGNTAWTYVVEVTSAPRDGLLDTINRIPRHVQAVLDVDVGPTQPRDNPREPAEQRRAGAIRPRYDPARTVEDTGACLSSQD